MTARRSILALLAIVAIALVGCGKNNESSGGSPAGSATPKGDQIVSLNGAGSTFAYPLYSKMMSEYNKLHPNIRINYQSIGSGGGIRQVTAGTVDFGGTDAPMTADETKKAPGKIFHIPTMLGAVVLTYNVPGVTAELKFTSDVVADIYLGKITKWNDKRLTDLNPDAKLPDTAISVVYRSDGSGTTAVYTDYLSKVSSDWKDKVGAGKSVKWPVGLGAKGNEGVTGQVKTTPGAIGYIELAYAMQNKLPMALLKNKAGKFVKPTIPGITAAAAGTDLPDTLYASITDAAGDDAYPISSYSYLLLYADQKDATKGEALTKFVWWAVNDGQKYSAALDYAPLPDKVVKQVDARLKTVTAGGKPLL